MSKHTPKGANTTWQDMASIGRHWQTCSYRSVLFTLGLAINTQCLETFGTESSLSQGIRENSWPGVHQHSHCEASRSLRTWAATAYCHTVWPCRSVLRGTSWKVLQCSYMFLLHCGCVASLRKVCGWSFESWLRNSGLSAAWSRGQSLDR
jgi:hypothetical protein